MCRYIRAWRGCEAPNIRCCCREIFIGATLPARVRVRAGAVDASGAAEAGRQGGIVTEGTPRVCRCGHERGAHEHYRRGSDCSLCPSGECSRYRTARPVNLFGRLRGILGRRDR